MKKLRVKTPQSDIVPLRLDEENGEFWKGDERLRLSRKPFAMLRLLVEHRPKWVSKDDFYNEIWKPKDEDVMDWTFTTYVYDIRKALGDETKPHRYVETRANKGYRFIGLITHSDQSKRSSEANAGHPTAGVKQIEFELTPDPRPPIPYVVGRELELERLHKWFDRALGGERQLVFITGEPGIGKTTLVRAFLREVATSGVAAIGRGQCIEHYGPGEAYLPVLEAIGRLCRDPRGSLLVEWMKQHTPAWLVQMPTLLNPTELAEVQRKVPGATQERMLREMSEGLEVLTEQIPFILVLEDLHWSDVSTLDLLSSLAQRTEPARLLIIGTYRPEEGLAERHPLRAITQELQGKRLCQELPLPLLDEAAVREYIQQRFPAAMLPTRLPETLHRNTEGSPLFVTAVVDDLLERGVITQVDGRWVLQGPVDALVAEVPVSIRQLLTRQIDRLNEKEQQIMQAASVAGQEFSCAAVAAAVGIDTTDVEACCEILVRRQQFLRPAGHSEWPDGVRAARYGFRHALYQYLWNERVPTGQRQQFHMQIGDRLERAYGSRAGEIAVELAVHFDQGRGHERAVRYLQQAAQNALGRSAYYEAANHLMKELELLRGLPDTPEHNQYELALQSTLGPVLIATNGWAAPEAGTAYARALELCRELGQSRQLFLVTFGQWAFHLVRGEHRAACELARQLLSLAQYLEDSSLTIEAHWTLGCSLFFLGEFGAAREQLEQGISQYDSQQHGTLAFLYGQDPGMSCLCYTALILWRLGYPDQALGQSQAALSLARTLNHPFSLAWATTNVVLLHKLLRKEDVGLKLVDEGSALCTEQGFAFLLASFSFLQHSIRGARNQSREGVAQMHQSLASYRTMGAEMYVPSFLTLLAEAYGDIGKSEQGLAMQAEAFAVMQQTEERNYEAELWRVKGELLLKSQVPSPKSKVQRTLGLGIQSRESEAEECFLKALEVAQQQGAKSFELRALTSLARLWRRQGKREQARQRLVEIYGWFTEGFDTADLQGAKALLAELSDEKSYSSRSGRSR